MIRSFRSSLIGVFSLRSVSARSPVPMRAVIEPVLGASSARNRGVRESQGDLIAFLDDDVTIGEGGIADWKRPHESFAEQCCFLVHWGHLVEAFRQQRK
jgi:hypothetical protein